ncbi:MAG TPA: hypothetical protein VIH90_06410, partial [Candidatus Saccharimonadales bacterium]
KISRLNIKIHKNKKKRIMNILKKLRRDSNGFGHIETILIVLVVAAIAGVGFFVYQNHSKTGKHTIAHAGSWTYLYTTPTLQYGGNISVWGCQGGSSTMGSSVVVKGKIAFTKSAGTPGYWYSAGVSPNAFAQPWSNSYWAGTFGLASFNPNFNNSGSTVYIWIQSAPNRSFGEYTTGGGNSSWLNWAPC